MATLMYTATKLVVNKTQVNRRVESKMFQILVISNQGKGTFTFQSITYWKTPTLLKVNLKVQHRSKAKTIGNRKMETKTSIKITWKYQTQKYRDLNPSIWV